MIILVAFAIVMTSIFTGGSTTGGTSSTHGSPGTGEEGHLQNGASGASVPVAESRAAFDEMVNAKTDRSIATIVLGGRAFLVDQGTRIAVVDNSGFGVKQVRILEGPMVGRLGFVPDEWCRD